MQVDRFLPAGALERAALAVKDKQCRFCDIKRTVTATGSRGVTQMTLEEFNQMTPIEVAQRYFMDKNNAAMSEAQKEMFNMIYQTVKEENRQ